MHSCYHHHTSGSKRTITSKSFPPSLCCCCVCVCGKNTNINSTLARIFKVHETLLLTLGTRLQADLGNTLYRVPNNILSPPQPRSLTSFGPPRRIGAFQAGVCASLPRGQVATCSEEVETATSPNLLSCPSVPHGHTGCSVCLWKDRERLLTPLSPVHASFGKMSLWFPAPALREGMLFHVPDMSASSVGRDVLSRVWN